MYFLKLLLLVSFISFQASGEEINPTVLDDELIKLESSVRAKPIKRVPPKYPKGAARRGKEGWVVLSLGITEEGEVENVEVIDRSGDFEFTRSARRAVKQWKYSPAMQNGEKTYSCTNSVRLDFKLSKGGATDEFIEQYSLVSTLLKQGPSKLLSEEIKNLGIVAGSQYEQSRVHYLKAFYYQVTEQPRKRMVQLKRLAGYKNNSLNEAQKQQVLSSLFVLQTSFNLYADAIETYTKLKKKYPNGHNMLQLTDYKKAIDSLIDGDEYIDIKGEIRKNGTLYRYSLARRSFSLSHLTGSLKEIEVRCGYQYSKYTAKANQVWDIPKSWGACDVFVRGDAGSTFIISEHPETVKKPEELTTSLR